MLIICLVLSAAAPANAATFVYFWSQGHGHSIGAGGATWLYYDNDTAYPKVLAGRGQVTKANQDGNDWFVCAETWVDYHLQYHRAPDVYFSCRKSTFTSGINHLNAPAGFYVTQGHVDGSYGTWADIAVCRVDARLGRFFRNTGTCSGNLDTDGDGPDEGIDVAAYNGRSYTQLAQITTVNKPQYVLGEYGTAVAGVTLANDALITLDGKYHATMQSDGNFVIYNNLTNRAVWSTGTNGHWGARAVMQGDGNFVIYNTNNQAVWASSWFAYTFYGGTRMVMQGDGNLVMYTPWGSPVWASNTVGR